MTQIATLKTVVVVWRFGFLSLVLGLLVVAVIGLRGVTVCTGCGVQRITRIRFAVCSLLSALRLVVPPSERF